MQNGFIAGDGGGSVVDRKRNLYEGQLTVSPKEKENIERSVPPSPPEILVGRLNLGWAVGSDSCTLLQKPPI